jgi:tryptophan 2,3-dioxygenase
MTTPAAWNDDSACDHDVDYAYQTHYCTYIRVPRLLTTQTPRFQGELWLITVYQWYELWFKVLLTDLSAAGNADGATLEPAQLVRRGIEVLKLFDLQADLAESVVLQEMGLRKDIHAKTLDSISQQFSLLSTRSSQMTRFENLPFIGLAEAAREYRTRFHAFSKRFQDFLSATLSLQTDGAQTYAEWLHLPELLALQNGVKGDWAAAGAEPARHWQPEFISADENLFIIVHQCFEIWFKVLLDQIDRAIPALVKGDIATATQLVRHIVLIQRLLVSQIQLPATMLPLDFMRFRNQVRERDGVTLTTGLSPASGTESYQFREIEIVGGLRDDPVFQKYLTGTDKLPIRLLTTRQAERMKQPTLPEAFRRAVEQRGLGSLDDLFTPSGVANPNADLAQLADLLIQFDEFFWLWRINHLSMVEKMIGARSGTGFLGPEYLKETAGIQIQPHNRIFPDRQVRPRFFEDLWAVRTRLGSM